MDNNRMSTADMLQYCNEALAWDDFGPVDIFFFESVKKIITGQCSAFDSPDDEEVIDDLMGIERPVRDVELEPDYDKYADIFYGEDGEDEVPDYSLSDEDKAFADIQFSDGFFDENEDDENEESEETSNAEDVSAPDAEPSDAEPQEDTAAAEADAEKPAAKKASVKSTGKKSAKKSAAKAESEDDALPEENKHEENTSGSFTVNI